jgi:hypothetical protein
MKLCTTIASLLALANCAWADPTFDWVALRAEGDRLFCQVDVRDLQDLAITESKIAYAVLPAQSEPKIIIPLGKISPQTVSASTVVWVKKDDFYGLTTVEIVLCDSTEEPSLSKMRYPKQYYDHPHHYDRLGKPYERGLGPFNDWEKRQAAQDASAAVDASRIC